MIYVIVIRIIFTRFYKIPEDFRRVSRKSFSKNRLRHTECRGKGHVFNSKL